MTTLADFRHALYGPDLLARLRQGLIGDDMPITTPFGQRRLLYADYVASGRALRQVERFISEEVLPFYANSHTEASHCGQTMTRLRQEARSLIARELNAEDCHVVFSGSGATAGINRIVALLDIAAGVRRGERISVLIGPYEHHSNLLAWRESGAHVTEIPEGDAGGPDPVALEQALVDAAGSDLIVGAFSAASNVTGIISDVDDVTRRLKRPVPWQYGITRCRPLSGDGHGARAGLPQGRHRLLTAQVRRRPRRLRGHGSARQRGAAADAFAAGRRHGQLRLALGTPLQRQPGGARGGRHAQRDR